MSNTDALNALQHIQSHLGELNLNEGDYLTLSNNLKTVYKALPQHEVPNERFETTATPRRRIAYSDYESIVTAFKAEWQRKEVLLAQKEDRSVQELDETVSIEPLDEALTAVADGYGTHKYFNYPELLDDLVYYDGYYIIAVDKVEDVWKFTDVTSDTVFADTVMASDNGNCKDLSSTILLLTNAPDCDQWENASE